LSYKGCESEFSHPSQQQYGTCVIYDKCMQVVYNSLSIYMDKNLVLIVCLYINISNAIMM